MDGRVGMIYDVTMLRYMIDERYLLDIDLERFRFIEEFKELLGDFLCVDIW